MKKLEVTLYGCAERYQGLKEIPGLDKNDPLILHMLKMDDPWPESDEVPWCSAFLNFQCFHLGLPRSKSKKARSWATIGWPVGGLLSAVRGFDIAVLKRGGYDGLGGGEPGLEDLEAPGHVTLFSRYEVQALSDEDVRHWLWGLGGNQNNSVNLSRFPGERLLCLRRLWPPPE